jgi:hypothetical protein
VIFNCEIDNLRTLKRGSKLTLTLDEKNTKILLSSIVNFTDKPLQVNLGIDAAEQLERLKQISQEQRRKIYAIYKDIEDYTGQGHESVKEETKLGFIQVTKYDYFSLSNCSKELATDYIEYLLMLCFRMGVPLSENPADGLDDIERYIRLTIKNEVCALCGKPGEVHHWDAIGMGRDRKKYDDSEHRKICLCRGHHSEAETIGRDTFADKYHVYGVLVA